MKGKRVKFLTEHQKQTETKRLTKISSYATNRNGNYASDRLTPTRLYSPYHRTMSDVYVYTKCFFYHVLQYEMPSSARTSHDILKKDVEQTSRPTSFRAHVTSMTVQSK
jgi:hypothetical protein